MIRDLCDTLEGSAVVQADRHADLTVVRAPAPPGVPLHLLVRSVSECGPCKKCSLLQQASPSQLIFAKMGATGRAEPTVHEHTITHNRRP